MQEINRNKKPRLIGMDLFRILAAVLIFLFHSIIHLQCNFGPLQFFVEKGNFIMTGFFMLSGFSIYYGYGDRDLTDLKRVIAFYKKRAIGILPAYLLLTFVMVFMTSEPVWRIVAIMPVELLGIQNVFTTLSDVFHNGGTWFISCILFCYLIFPFVQNCVKQMSLKFKIGLMCVMGFILLYSTFVVHLFNTVTIYGNPYIRILEFVVGVLLASILPELQKNKIIKKIFLNKFAVIIEVVILILGVWLGQKLGINDIVMYSWICLPVCCMLFPALACTSWGVFEKSKIVSYAGAISYSFWLAQHYAFPLTKWVVEATGYGSGMFKLVCSFVLCVLLGAIIHEVVEKPCKKLYNNS